MSLSYSRKKQIKRAMFIFFIITIASIILAIILSQAKQHLIFFKTIRQVKNQNYVSTKTIRLSGIIKKNSIKRKGPMINFILKDKNDEIYIKYQGEVPYLFGEEQCIVVDGTIEKKQFIAKNIFIKHGSVYKPRHNS